MLFGGNFACWKSHFTDWNLDRKVSFFWKMKTVVTNLAFLFVWISLCVGRVPLTGGDRPSFCSLPKGMMYSSFAHLVHFRINRATYVPMNNNVAYNFPCTLCGT